MNTRIMALRMLLIGLLVVVLGAITVFALWPGYWAHLYQSAPPQVTTTGIARVGGPFRLKTHNGRVVSEKDFLGRNLIVFFGYASATDTTPAAMQLITDVLDRLGDRAKEFQPLFITIDPKRDTQQRLAKFVRRYHPDFIALTGGPENIASIANAYHVKFRERPDTTGATKQFDQTSYIYVMGQDGTYAGHFPLTVASGDLTDRLRDWP